MKDMFLAFLGLLAGVYGLPLTLDAFPQTTATATALRGFTFRDIVHERNEQDERELATFNDYLEYTLCGKAMETMSLDNGQGIKSFSKGLVANKCVVCDNALMPDYKSCELVVTETSGKVAITFDLYTDTLCLTGKHSSDTEEAPADGCFLDSYEYSLKKDVEDVKPDIMEKVGYSMISYGSTDCGSAMAYMTLGAVQGSCLDDVRYESCDGNVAKKTTYQGGNCAREPRSSNLALGECKDHAVPLWDIPQNDGFVFDPAQSGTFKADIAEEQGNTIFCPSLYPAPTPAKEVLPLPIGAAIAIGFGVCIMVSFCCGIGYWYFSEKSRHEASVAAGIKKSEGDRAAKQAAAMRGAPGPPARSPMHGDMGRL